MAREGEAGVLVADPRSGGGQRDDGLMERHDDGFRADVEDADDDGMMDHLSDPGVYFQQETANELALSQAMRWGSPDDDVANKSNYSHTTPVSPTAGDLDRDGSPSRERGEAEAEMAREEAEKSAFLSDASVENVALWSRSRTTMEHDDYDRLFDAHGGLHPGGDRGKMRAEGDEDEGEEGEDGGKFGEGGNEGFGYRDGTGADGFDADEDYDNGNDNENDDVMGFQFWRTSLQQDGSADGQHADDAESARVAEYGTMWHNMTGHLENMKDDWAEAQAVAEGEAGARTRRKTTTMRGARRPRTPTRRCCWTTCSWGCRGRCPCCRGTRRRRRKRRRRLRGMRGRRSARHGRKCTSVQRGRKRKGLVGERSRFLWAHPPSMPEARMAFRSGTLPPPPPKRTLARGFCSQ
ncbi:hypothetical protein CLOP_g2091 [Closterium sp. NIES-67]|nr:hypothetical protein CLOP_g2091 [Closterium sp. NIES-67]